MKENILYHGTDTVINEPSLDKCNKYRDFGQCFYLTYNKKMANDWARKKSKDHPVVNKYTINFSTIESGKLKIKRFKADGEWAEFIYNNRYNENFKRPAYDIIIGPLGDNSLKEHFNESKSISTKHSKQTTQYKEIEALLKEKTFKEIAAEIEYKRYNAIQVCFCSDYALKILRRIEK